VQITDIAPAIAEHFAIEPPKEWIAEPLSNASKNV
jgi:hypothetical protein